MSNKFFVGENVQANVQGFDMKNIECRPQLLENISTELLLEINRITYKWSKNYSQFERHPRMHFKSFESSECEDEEDTENHSVSLLWYDNTCADYHDGPREDCDRCEQRKGCYYCGCGGPLYFLLHFSTSKGNLFGLLKGESGCESYDGNEYEIILWLSGEISNVMENIPKQIKSELDEDIQQRTDAILLLLPSLSHIPHLVEAIIIPFLSFV